LELLALSLLTVVASFVLGVTGFGFAVVLMGFFPLVIGIKSASVLVAFVGLPILFYLLIPLIKHIEWKALLRVLIGLGAGTPLGIWVLIRIEEGYLMIGLGVFLVFYLAYDALVHARTKRRLPRFVGYVAGFIGGAFGGAYNTNGPPVVAYVSSLHLEKHVAKATILAYIAFAALYKLGFLVYKGMITRQMLLYAAVLLGPTFAGMLLGKLVFNRVSSTAFRWAVQGLLLAIAILMIVKGIRA
jgi:uncharacterized membrane protein YfcA